MTGEVFERWIAGILPKLPRNTVIVMDNDPYHSVKAEKTPTSAWRKAIILAFLQEKGIAVKEGALEVLLVKAKEFVSNHPVQYRIDLLVANTGREVLRLPPYHCQLNPIELIWAQVKGYVAANNKSFKLPDVKILFDEDLAEVTAQKWQNCIGHVLRQEEDMYQLDNIADEIELEFNRQHRLE
jgi:transposase